MITQEIKNISPILIAIRTLFNLYLIYSLFHIMNHIPINNMKIKWQYKNYELNNVFTTTNHSINSTSSLFINIISTGLGSRWMQTKRLQSPNQVLFTYFLKIRIARLISYTNWMQIKHFFKFIFNWRIITNLWWFLPYINMSHPFWTFLPLPSPNTFIKLYSD